MQLRPSMAEMSGHGAELFPSYSDVVARREWEIGLIKEKLEKGEVVDLPLCRLERVAERYVGSCATVAVFPRVDTDASAAAAV